VEALAEPGLQLPGRYMHLSAEDLRMREVPQVLADYQLLYVSHASLADTPPAAPAGGRGSVEPAPAAAAAATRLSAVAGRAGG
jgi:hypothetical protein